MVSSLPGAARAVKRRKTSSRRWRPARRSPNWRSRSASHAASSATERGNRRGRYEVLTRWSFAHPSTEANGELVDGETGRRGEAKLFRLALELSLAPGSHDGAMVDDDDPVGQALHLVELMAREDHAHAVVAQAGDDVAHHYATRRVDAGGRLVQEGHAGLADERQRQREPLLFPTRESFVRCPRDRAKPDEIEDILGVPGILVIGREQVQARSALMIG